jgi:FtsP/CotA-like multicopper oxidase with cupredoxin domain
MHLFGLLGLLFSGLGVLICSYLAVLWFMGHGIGDRPLLLLGVLLILMLNVLPATQYEVEAQSLHPRLLDAGAASELPTVLPNDNRTSAGLSNGGVLEVDLEVAWADWRIETGSGPGLVVAAIAESGSPPMIPAPMIRVETGTRVRVRIANTLPDSAITVFGLQTRPASDPDSLVVPVGEVGTVEFDAGDPGTYMYWIRLGFAEMPIPEAEEEQLAGAFVVDPVGGSPDDRVFVMNIFSTPVDSTIHPDKWLEALTINGLSWPYTERIRPAVGDTLRWRVVNASRRTHPMHLHGFYYDVTSRGEALQDDIYEPELRRKVVTETMRRRSTMALEWVATRPGNWLFHCHLSFHVAPNIRLPGAAEANDEGHHSPHMVGLVLGIEIQDGPSDLIFRGEPRNITLYANEYESDSTYAYGFSVDPDFRPDSTQRAAPGPLLTLQRYQPTYVTVVNRMSIPTGVHWHGLELDSWADGVPGWSASEGRVSPVIDPGEQFTYKLAAMRPGTFIYHSHLDDVHQLTGGLYGAMVVMDEGEEYDPEKDHIEIVGWRTPDPSSLADAELNGKSTHPTQKAQVGETHRLRLINIAPAGRVFLQVLREGEPFEITAIAKDGADFPVHQRVPVEQSARLGVGETADFAFTPDSVGTYELVVGYGQRPESQWKQEWIVEGD